MNGKMHTCKHAPICNPNPNYSALSRILKVKPYPTKRWILETLIGYVEASRCRTLDTYTTMEVKDHDKR